MHKNQSTFFFLFSDESSLILFYLSALELKPVGTLEVKLVQAKDLTNKDIIGKSDPYVVLFIRPLPDRTKTSKIIVIQFLYFINLFLPIFDAVKL